MLFLESRAMHSLHGSSPSSIIISVVRADVKNENEKSAVVASNLHEASNLSLSISRIPNRDLDEAYHYLQNARSSSETDSDVGKKALRRKIDRRIVPIIFCAYTMQFIDKVLLNVRRCLPSDFDSSLVSIVTHDSVAGQYAAVMGLNTDLKLNGNDFTNAATAFFIAYLIAEIPNGKSIPYALPIAETYFHPRISISLHGVK